MPTGASDGGQSMGTFCLLRVTLGGCSLFQTGMQLVCGRATMCANSPTCPFSHRRLFTPHGRTINVSGVTGYSGQSLHNDLETLHGVVVSECACCVGGSTGTTIN